MYVPSTVKVKCMSIPNAVTCIITCNAFSKPFLQLDKLRGKEVKGFVQGPTAGGGQQESHSLLFGTKRVASKPLKIHFLHEFLSL